MQYCDSCLDRKEPRVSRMGLKALPHDCDDSATCDCRQHNKDHRNVLALRLILTVDRLRGGLDAQHQDKLVRAMDTIEEILGCPLGGGCDDLEAEPCTDCPSLPAAITVLH